MYAKEGEGSEAPKGPMPSGRSHPSLEGFGGAHHGYGATIADGANSME
jgi:hypothetical protein